MRNVIHSRVPEQELFTGWPIKARLVGWTKV